MNKSQPSAQLTAAFIDCLEADYGAVLSARTAPERSADFRARMLRLLEKEKRASHRLVNAAWKRALIAAIVALLLLAAVACAVPAIRKSIAGLLIRENNIYGEILAADITREQIDDVYGLTLLPDGFSEAKEPIINSTAVMRLYSDKSGACINLMQTCSKFSQMTYDTENGKLYEKDTGKFTVYMHVEEMGGMAFWVYDGYRFTVTAVDVPLNEDSFIEIINSVNIVG